MVNGQCFLEVFAKTLWGLGQNPMDFLNCDAKVVSERV